MDFIYCFYPHFCSATQWLIRTIYYLTWAIYYNFMTVGIVLIGLHCNDWLSLACLCITFNNVLIYMYDLFHFSTLFGRIIDT